MGQPESVSLGEPSKQTLSTTDHGSSQATVLEASSESSSHAEVVCDDRQTSGELSIEELRQKRLKQLEK